MRAPGSDRKDTLFAVGAASALFAFAVAGGGAIGISRTGTLLTLVVLAATAVFGRSAWTGRLPQPFGGATAVFLIGALAALAAVSVSWSILPGDSYFDATRLIAYAAMLASGALAAQLMPNRARAAAAGLLLGALLICLYALLSRVHPQWFPVSDAYARIRLPFEYWNAVGSVAVFGLAGSLWLGTARGMREWAVTASFPIGALFVVTLALSQSRGAMAAAFVTIGLWLLLAPRRIRSTGWLALVLLFAVPVIAWAFGQTALSQDFAAQSLRESTGGKFGLLLLFMCASLVGIGYAFERARRERPLSTARRRAVGRALLVALAISPFALAGVVAVSSDEGLGRVTSAVGDMFDADKAAPSNSPDRLTQTSSLRARYWRDAFKIFADNRLHGTGADTYSAARLPYRHDTIKVRHAHGFVPQTLGDLGLYGLVLMIALTVAWLIALGRAAGAAKALPYTWLESADDSRLAGLTIALVATAFGLHSAVDWTWYTPGVAAFGLLAAGWTFGSRRTAGGTQSTAARDTGAAVPRDGTTQRLLRAAGITVVGLAAAWAVYQPAMAARKVNGGYQLLADGRNVEALKAGADAHDIDPTSDKPFYLEAAAHENLKQRKDADAILTRIASIQPANPDTWIRLADYRLNVLGDPARALDAIRPLLFLSPNNERGTALRDQAERELETQLLQQQIDRERRRLKREIERMKKAADAG